MKTFLKFVFYLIGGLVVLGIIAYFVWFHNTHKHTLRLDPTIVFAQQANHQGYLITNANVVDVVSGSIIEKQHLLIIDDRINRIFSGAIPDTLTNYFTVYDAENQYIMPGLFDMHTHLNSGGLIPPDESIRKSALEQFIRYGITTIYTLGGHGFNEEITIELKRKQQNKEIVAPDMYATGDLLTATGGYPISILPLVLGKPIEAIDLKEVGVIEVTENTNFTDLFSEKKKKGIHGIKLMLESNIGGNNPEPRLTNALAKKAISTAANYDMPVFAHVSRQEDLQDAIQADVNVIAHTVGNEVMKNTPQLFEKMKADSIYYVPTLSIAWMFQFVKDPVLLNDSFLIENSSRRTTRSLENWPIRQLVMRDWGEETFKYNEVMSENFRLMHKAGVPIMMGSDAGNLAVIPGYSSHLELEFMTKAGMSNSEALRAATIVPAKFLGIDKESGTITSGKLATFIVLEKNPLEDIRNTRTLQRVMHRGVWIE